VTRAEKVAEAQRLQARGLLQREIAARMGVSFKTVNAWLNDPDLSRQRERRKRYQGTCKHCGAATDGSNGKAAAPDVCARCLPFDPDWLAAITYWTSERIIEAIRYWNVKYGEPPAVADWRPHRSRTMNDSARAARSEREHAAGKVPSSTHVYKRFPSWNAALEAAGFTPRAPYGGAGNQYRRRAVRAKARTAA
jgi:transposase